MPSYYQSGPPRGMSLRDVASGGDRITQLILARGQAQAEGAQRAGEISSNAAQGIISPFTDLAQQAAGAMMKRDALKAEQSKVAERSRAWTAYLKSEGFQKDPQAARMKAIELFGEEGGQKQFDGVVAASKIGRVPIEEARKSLGEVAAAIDDLDEKGRAELYPQFRSLSQQVFPEIELSPDYSPERWKVLSPLAAKLRSEKPPGTREIKTRNSDGSETIKLVTDTPNQTFESAAPQPKMETLTVPGPNGPMAKSVSPEDLAKGVPVYREPKTPHQPAFQAKEVLDDTGKPVMANFDSRTGQFLNASSGQPIKNPRPTPVQQRLTKEERQDFAAWDYALPKLGKFTKYVQDNPDKWGKWDAMKQSLKQALPGLADGDYASQEAFIARINSEIRHALYGASLTGGEQQSADGFIVNMTDQPERIIAKVNEAAERGRSNVEYYRRLGFDLPVAPTSSGTTAAPASAAQSGPPKRVTRAEYAKLAVGAQYIAPDGKVRTKK